MTQLDIFSSSSLPQFVLDSIEWAYSKNGELVIVINGNSTGAGHWLRQNLQLKAVTPMGETGQTAVKAIAPAWVSELKQKKWSGGSGSSHPVNDIKW